MPKASKSQPITRKGIFITAGLILLLMGLVFSLEKMKVINIYEQKPVTTEEGVEAINYRPPTEEERRAGDEKKQEIVNSSSETEQSLQTASVVIVDASQYEDQVEVRAFAANVVKNGTCTISFKKGSVVLQKQVDAFADASTTPCMNLVVPRSEFSESGQWTVEVVFSASGVNGKSEKVMEIN